MVVTSQACTYLPTDLPSDGAPYVTEVLGGVMPSHCLTVWQVSFVVGYSRSNEVESLYQGGKTVRSHQVEKLGRLFPSSH